MRHHGSNLYCEAAMPESLLDRFSTALVAALATTLVAVSAEWLKQRGQEARVKREVDQATSRVNFLSAWLTLQERISQSQAEAARVAIAEELVAIREETERAWATARQTQKSTVRQALRKLLMLGVGRSRYVYFLRSVYWIALVWLVVIAIPEFVIDVTHPPASVESWANWLGWMSGRFVEHALIALALVISLRYLIRFWDIEKAPTT
jgi:hypothetical protein